MLAAIGLVIWWLLRWRPKGGGKGGSEVGVEVSGETVGEVSGEEVPAESSVSAESGVAARRTGVKLENSWRSFKAGLRRFWYRIKTVFKKS